MNNIPELSGALPLLSSVWRIPRRCFLGRNVAIAVSVEPRIKKRRRGRPSCDPGAHRPERFFSPFAAARRRLWPSQLLTRLPSAPAPTSARRARERSLQKHHPRPAEESARR
ncbi:hypothetical protein PAHAL_6G213100 [Panicum hallii]|uniref:Uncharacterized protein n=1 Tax=Panicum hallii TaxID=206008 RepID=A0A2T8IH36_9POAL|nr:hypothetical protein PAHAL_6G213100 [Panicum hallii]